MAFIMILALIFACLSVVFGAINYVSGVKVLLSKPNTYEYGIMGIIAPFLMMICALTISMIHLLMIKP